MRHENATFRMPIPVYDAFKELDRLLEVANERELTRDEMQEFNRLLAEVRETEFYKLWIAHIVSPGAMQNAHYQLSHGLSSRMVANSLNRSTLHGCISPSLIMSRL